MVSPLYSIKSKIETSKRADMVDIYDTLMCEYGYIPLDDFNKMPMPMVMRLIDKIKQRSKKMEKQYGK